METKVVKVINETTVVIGAGKEQGVQEGMEFILFEVGEEIFDPETNESLGKLEIVKGHVFVTNVQERLSVAQTESNVVTRTKVHSPGENFMRLAGYRTEEYQVREENRLKVEQSDRDYAKRVVVRVGDRAKSVAKV
jgi:hypothetical protein